MNIDDHISVLGLDDRTTNALLQNNEPIDTVKKLTSKKDSELLRIGALGRKSINHIKEKLAIHNLTLGGNLKEVLYAKNINLRDYLAAKAMQGFCANISRDLSANIEFFTRTAYKVADAMMKARNE